MRWLTVGVGVANVALIAWIVQRHLGAIEATVAAVVYAVLPEAVYSEHSVIIEPWLNLTCLAALFLWLSVDDGEADRRLGARERARAAGVLLALALTFKLWAVFCVAACVLAAPRRARRDRLVDLALGGGVALGLLWAPLLLAPRDALDQIVRFQVDRPADGVEGRLSRLGRMTRPIEITDAGWLRAAFVVVVVVAGVVIAWRLGSRFARLTVLWFSITLAAFLVPSAWWEQYSAHLAAPFALLCGCAAHGAVITLRAPTANRRTVMRFGGSIVLLALLAGFVVDSLRYSAEHAMVTIDAARDIDRIVPDDACVVALEPGWLVMADRLPDAGETTRFAVDPYASLILGEDLTSTIDGCEFVVVSDLRLSMLPPELREVIESEFETRSDPRAGIRVLERK
jgi:hypothetical protein